MQSGPIAAFSANAAKNACFDRLPYAEQGALFGKSPCTTPFDGLPYGEQDPLSQQAPYAERNARLRQASIRRAGRCQPPERAFDCPNAHFMQDRCHVRITGCSSFLTFHAGVESIGPLRRNRRPLKRNQLQKEAGFLLLKTGARPKRNSRRDVGLCSCRDVGS